MTVDFTDARRVPFAPGQVATTAYDLVFSTGYFTDSCRRWKSKLSAGNTWENFKPFFTDEHQTWQETQPSSADNIYPLANAFDWKTEKTVDTIALLAAATANDPKTYLNPANTVTSLTAKVSLVDKNLVAALQNNARLERLLRKCR